MTDNNHEPTNSMFLVMYHSDNGTAEYETAFLSPWELDPNNHSRVTSEHLTSWHNSGGKTYWRYARTECEAKLIVDALSVIEKQPDRLKVYDHSKGGFIQQDENIYPFDCGPDIDDIALCLIPLVNKTRSLQLVYCDLLKMMNQFKENLINSLVNSRVEGSTEQVGNVSLTKWRTVQDDRVRESHKQKLPRGGFTTSELVGNENRFIYARQQHHEELEEKRNRDLMLEWCLSHVHAVSPAGPHHMPGEENHITHKAKQVIKEAERTGLIEPSIKATPVKQRCVIVDLMEDGGSHIYLEGSAGEGKAKYWTDHLTDAFIFDSVDDALAMLQDEGLVKPKRCAIWGVEETPSKIQIPRIENGTTWKVI